MPEKLYSVGTVTVYVSSDYVLCMFTFQLYQLRRTYSGFINLYTVSHQWQCLFCFSHGTARAACWRFMSVLSCMTLGHLM